MKIDKDALKKQVILHLPYLLFLLVFAKLGEAVRLAPGADASQKLLGLSEGFALAFQSMWPGAALDWLVGLCGAAAVRLAVYLKGKDAKKYRKNVEYGSARWGNKTDMANREWGQMGTGYLRSLFALGFQGFLILVCVAIYAVLVQSIPASGDIHGAIWGTAGYTVLLAFALFKTGSLSKSIFNAR